MRHYRQEFVWWGNANLVCNEFHCKFVLLNEKKENKQEVFKIFK